MSDWLELELARELRPVRAPEALWGRVQAQERQRATPKRQWAPNRPLLAAAAVVLVAAAVWNGRPANLESLAARELGQSAQLELRSADPVEIGIWLRRQAGLEVTLPQSARAHLRGARVIREHGALIGEVSYQVEEDAAVLLIARTGGAYRNSAQHGGSSWQKQQQIYALAATAVRPQAACVLCHSDL
jgi:hypothetical protein